MSKEQENQKREELKTKIRNFFVRTAVAAQVMAPTASMAKSFQSETPEPQAKHYVMPEATPTQDDASTITLSAATPKKNQDKYKTTVTCVNDTVDMAGNSKAYYSRNKDGGQIHRVVGEMKMSDFFSNAKDTDIPEELALVHERQHQINYEVKKLNNKNLSLSEYYQSQIHDEITARISEKLEIRRQYKEAKTKEEKEAVLNKFANTEGNVDYVAAIRSGHINPDSKSPKDFAKEMTFIKESTTKYITDDDGGSYRENWEKSTLTYFNEVGQKAQSNPKLFQQTVKDLYQIGGIDFTQYGNHKDFLLENEDLKVVEKLASQGVENEQIFSYAEATKNNKDLFKIAETIDITGLSREQAEKVIQTAIIAQNSAELITENVALGKQAGIDFRYMSRQLKEASATYLAIKEDMWEKNNQLTEAGDPQKFEECMKQAKTITLDTKSWYKSVADPSSYWYGKFNWDAGGGQEAVAKRVEKYHGTQITIDEAISNINEMQMPLGNRSAKDVYAEIQEKKAQEAEEDAKFWEEYNKNHPADVTYSDPIEVEITDFQSSILKDEYMERMTQNRLNNITQMKDPTEQQTPAIHLENQPQIIQNKQTYQSAELCNFYNENGMSAEMTLINGKPHGLATLRDAKGNIVECKLYDNGKEIDLTKNTFEIKEKEEQGTKMSIVFLNGKPFGTVSQITSDNNATVGFFDNNGQMMQAGNSSKITNTISSFDTMPIEFSSYKSQQTRNDIAQTMHAQEGALPNTQSTAHNQDEAFDRVSASKTQTQETETQAPQNLTAMHIRAQTTR